MLLPLYHDNDDWHLLFIRRAEHEQDRHSGEVGFPGGCRELHDTDAVATALREASEEIAARVWYQLIANDFELLRRFDSDKGPRLHPYLTSICRHQTLNYRKEERRRRARESNVAAAEGTTRLDSETAPVQLSNDFTGTLSDREREYFEVFLLARQPQQNEELTDANTRQLRCRVRRKLLDFLEQ